KSNSSLHNFNKARLAGVNTHCRQLIITLPGMIMHPHFGGKRHLLEFFLCYVVYATALSYSLARLYFYKIHTFIFFSYDIYLAVPGFPVQGDHLESLLLQERCRLLFGIMPRLIVRYHRNAWIGLKVRRCMGL